MTKRTITRCETWKAGA